MLTTKLPGFGLPLSWMPHGEEHFPIVVDDDDRDWGARPLSIREVCMLRFLEEITNKPDWWLKVRDDAIAVKWKEEALAMDWTEYRLHAEFSPAMAEACISELRAKADMYEKIGLVPVMDHSACALKSDSLIPDALRDALNKAVAPLENVPDHLKDWHPDTGEKVLDLVHPSLWPLVYGRTRILPDKRIGVQDCLEHCGLGEVVAQPSHHDRRWKSGQQQLTWEVGWVPPFSSRFQWLPTDVSLQDGRAKIESYINNVHPVEHAALYPIIEQFIEKALPAWDIVYRWPTEFKTQRLSVKEVCPECQVPDICEPLHTGCRPSNRPFDDEDEDRTPRGNWDEGGRGYYTSQRGKRDLAWFDRTHPMDLPDPDPDNVSHLKFTASDIKTSDHLNSASRIQVIVKLATIHLTPDKPTYKGGSWHVEGQLNEHICSTALFYYDGDNITNCQLGLRTPVRAEELQLEVYYEQNDRISIPRAFSSVENEGEPLQDIGEVLTRPGRALFFPNLYQHRVSPFQLKDPSRPGFRKILALFLVDPAIPVISTANVPPQQQHWLRKEAGLDDSASALGTISKLPPELSDMVWNNVDCPYDDNVAKRLRDELMDEKSASLAGYGEGRATWNFCEH